LYSPPPSHAVNARGADAALAGIEAQHDFAERDLVIRWAVEESPSPYGNEL
jgi:hypothetical protein